MNSKIERLEQKIKSARERKEFVSQRMCDESISEEEFDRLDEENLDLGFRIYSLRRELLRLKS